MSDIRTKTTQVLQLGELLISGLEQELRLQVSDRMTKLSDSLLEAMLDSIKERKENVMNNRIPPRHMRHAYLTHRVNDSWNNCIVDKVRKADNRRSRN